VIDGLHLPSVNAGLNSLSAVFLLLGYRAIKFGRIGAHRIYMGCALTTSTIFLVSYLYHHYHAGSTKFLGTGSIRTLYFAILISHTILAAAIVPLVIATVIPALRGRFEAHARLARWTWPIWMYVSVTGVVVYWMLYQMPL
jgi:uncharacterized membrane protein YozB (DUF420 family)